MKGNEKVIEALNSALHGELTAINHFVQSKLCNKWGYLKLGAKQYRESLEELRHAEEAMQRIRFLDGTPITRTEQICLGSNLREMFEADLELELKGLKIYNQGIETCLKVGDVGSREVMEHILVQTENHVEWLEAQLHTIDEVGLNNYIADQIGVELECRPSAIMGHI